MRYCTLLALMSGMLLWGFGTPNMKSGTLSIEINNIKSPGGKVWIGIYDSESSFLIKEKAILEGVAIEKEGLLTVEIPDLKFGQYAVAVFHDENNNGKMDRNAIGIPSEPFAFSRIPKSKWRLPKFEEVKFSFNTPEQKLSTHLKKWWEKRRQK